MDPAPWGELGRTLSSPPTYMGCWGRAEIRWLQKTGETFVLYCVPCGVQKVTDCTWNLNLWSWPSRSPGWQWWCRGCKGCWRGWARCLDVLRSIFSRAVLSVFVELHESRSVRLHLVLCIKAGRGESNYLSSLGRSNRQDLLVLILKY